MSNPTGRHELEEKMRQEGRLPPGQSLTQKFPILHYGSVPAFDPESWVFRVWGEVEQELSWSWDEFQALPQTEITLDIHCVTRWSKFDTLWRGVSLKRLADEGYIHIKPGELVKCSVLFKGIFRVTIDLVVHLRVRFRGWCSRQ